MGPSGAASCSAAGAKGSSGGIMWKEEEEKRGLSACRYIPRDSLTGLITPVRKNLQGVSAGVGSSDTQRDDLCGQLHVVYPGRYNYSCGSVPVSLYL
jgi:hypothetical protein